MIKNLWMAGGLARRDLSRVLDTGPGPAASAKMEPKAATHGGTQEMEDSIADQDVCSAGPAGPTVSTFSLGCLSPTSTESLISRTLDDMPLSPMGDPTASPGGGEAYLRGIPSSPQDFSSMISTFATMLSRGLSQTANQITTAIQADLPQLGARIEIIENKSDQTITRVN